MLSGGIHLSIYFTHPKKDGNPVCFPDVDGRGLALLHTEMMQKDMAELNNCNAHVITMWVDTGTI